MAGRQWQAAGMLVLGVWLLVSPLLLDYAAARAAAANAYTVGAAAALLALVGLLRAPLWVAWAQLVLGLWLTASAFALAAGSPTAYWNPLAVGVLIVVLGLMAVLARRPQARRPGNS